MSFSDYSYRLIDSFVTRVNVSLSCKFGVFGVSQFRFSSEGPDGKTDWLVRLEADFRGASFVVKMINLSQNNVLPKVQYVFKNVLDDDWCWNHNVEHGLHTIEFEAKFTCDEWDRKDVLLEVITKMEPTDSSGQGQLS